MEWSITCDLIWFARSKVEAVLLYGTCYSTSVYHYRLLGCDSFQRTDAGYHCHRGVRLSLLPDTKGAVDLQPSLEMSLYNVFRLHKLWVLSVSIPYRDYHWHDCQQPTTGHKLVLHYLGTIVLKNKSMLQFCNVFLFCVSQIIFVFLPVFNS